MGLSRKQQQEQLTSRIAQTGHTYIYAQQLEGLTPKSGAASSTVGMVSTIALFMTFIHIIVVT